MFYVYIQFLSGTAIKKGQMCRGTSATKNVFSMLSISDLCFAFEILLWKHEP